MNILVLNAGSSSLKYAVLDTSNKTTLSKGQIERIGTSQAAYVWRDQILKVSAANHAEALAAIARREDFSSVMAVGHRVVHGGDTFQKPILVTDAVLLVLEQNAKFAPLHNPPNIVGIKAALAILPSLPNVAVFDTAFHATLPEYAYRYALPRELPFRRFGFHGTSHAYVVGQAAAFLERPLEQLKIISLHIGNGASACAVLHGKSIDTSMGF
ncbi:MAG: acetate kinase, partial [Deinococcales bacterium]